MSPGHICLRVGSVNCALSVSVQVCAGETYQHHAGRVDHVPHIGLQDVIMEGWSQHPAVLEPSLPIQEEQTIPWVIMGVCWKGLPKSYAGNLGGTQNVRRES